MKNNITWDKRVLGSYPDFWAVFHVAILWYSVSNDYCFKASIIYPGNCWSRKYSMGKNRIYFSCTCFHQSVNSAKQRLRSNKNTKLWEMNKTITIQIFMLSKDLTENRKHNTFQLHDPLFHKCRPYRQPIWLLCLSHLQPGPLRLLH